MSPTTTSLQRLMSNTPRSPLASSGSLMTSTTMTSPSVRRSLTRAEDEPITLKKKACSHDRTGKPVVCSLVTSAKKLRDTTLKMNRLGLSWSDKESRFSLTVKLRFENTSSRPITREEVFKSWVKRSSRKKKKFIVLIKETTDADKINNFFMNSYWSKIWISVKFSWEKVSLKWKNWSGFEVQHSTQLRGEKWSKIEILSLNTLARYRNCRMKSIVWTIREIFKMLSQCAVDISHVTSQPVSFPPHPDPGGMISRSIGMPSCREGPPSIFGTHMAYRGNFFANPAASSSAPYPQELNPWCSHISGPISRLIGREEWKPNTSSRSEMPVRTVSQKFSHPLWGRFFKELWSRPTTTANLRSSFWTNSPRQQHFACWKIRFKTEVCTCSQFPTEAMLWIKEVEMVDSVDELKSSFSARGIRSTRCENCFSTEQNHP